MPEYPAGDTTAPTQEDLYELAVRWTHATLLGAFLQCEWYHRTPARWPYLAAVLDHLGRKLTVHAAELSAALVSYAEAHPRIEVSDAPGVLLLTGVQHAIFWDEARRQACSIEQRADAIPDVGQYGDAVFGEYGRPGLAHRAVALDDGDAVFGAVMVLLYLAEAGRDAVVLVLIGVQRPEDDEQIQAALARENITSGRPQFWAPPDPAMFISLPDADGVYDAYGRRFPIADSRKFAGDVDEPR